MKKLVAGIVLATTCGLVMAGDEEVCLDCHEPSEDWEGMSAEQISAGARDPENDMHEDNPEFSDEALNEAITTLLAE